MKLAILLLLPTLSLSVQSKDLLDILAKATNDVKMGFLACPGFLLVKTCGNLKCETEKGESRLTCPSDCRSTPIRSYNHQTLCDEYTSIYKPRTKEEIQSAVIEAKESGRKVKVVGKLHSATKTICTNGVVISTQNLNKVHKLERFHGEETVVTDPGVSINDLSEWLYERGKSIGMTMIGYNGVSVAGSTATGSHGSSLKHPTVMASLIRSIELVKADGSIHEYHSKNTTNNEWKALRTSLGMLGIITKMRLKVDPAFNLKVKVDYKKDDLLLKDKGYRELIGNCDWGQINWFPRLGKMMRSCAHKTDEPIQEAAENRLLWPNANPNSVVPLKQIIQLGACSKSLNCTLEKFRFMNFKSSPPFIVKNKKNKFVNTNEVVGKSHKISSSPFISIKEGFFQMDWELAIPEPFITQALNEVKKIAIDNKMCLPLIGAFIRFTKVEDTTLLAHSSEGGHFKPGSDVAFIELPVYLPSGFSEEELKKHTSPYLAFVNAMIEKYHARAHWGKNADWVFKKQIKLGSFQDKIQSFQSVLNKFDPEGLFSNNFGKTIGLSWPNLMPSTPTSCTNIHVPVCANNREYRNTCHAREAGHGLRDLSLGSCN